MQYRRSEFISTWINAWSLSYGDFTTFSSLSFACSFARRVMCKIDIGKNTLYVMDDDVGLTSSNCVMGDESNNSLKLIETVELSVHAVPVQRTQLKVLRPISELHHNIFGQLCMKLNGQFQDTVTSLQPKQLQDCHHASTTSLLHSPSTEGVLTPSRLSSSSPPPTAVQQALRVGMRVEARYGVGEDWYDATIVEVQHKPGGNVSYDETTYSLRYDDGDEEQDVSRLKIRLKGEKQRGKLEVGERVDALCVRLDSSYVPGVVRRVLGDNSTSNARRNDASAASLLHSPSTEGVLTPSRQSSSSLTNCSTASVASGHAC